eukprot:gnl/TRDRNA2_/TRDRNA2_83595_c0_seq1.p1 gnl/TRDRNA2_/TRDRNA2_83595_c0~~gnl/TRDRNA2_/TRDRNA2_83595_c0_seq1.p1  ORF type:complete len:397 (-),score=57.65 gnl/TRDRNA2_/TRDRNA2_83595_c0_seq1:49-1218(-)
MTAEEGAAFDRADDECAVCLEPVTSACRAPCQHVFCRECILGALEIRPPKWCGRCPLCRRDVSVYNIRDINGAFLATPEVSTMYGSIFVQRGGKGVASYHFDAEDDCYISYARAPPDWRLDDGSEVPAKKLFSDARYDADSRTFRGVIHWDPSFGGDSRWEYEIVFAEDFSGVIGGGVRCGDSAMDHVTDVKFCAPWEDAYYSSNLSYWRWTPPPQTIFGSVFVQGILYAPLLEGIASYHFESETDCYISYSQATWRLDDGSPPPQKKAFTDISYDSASRVFRGTVRWDQSATFNGASRWEYEMLFAENFSRIVAGVFKTFGQDGEELPQSQMSFGDPASRYMQENEMFYVRRPYNVVTPQLNRSEQGQGPKPCDLQPLDAANKMTRPE